MCMKEGKNSMVQVTVYVKDHESNEYKSYSQIDWSVLHKWSVFKNI